MAELPLAADSEDKARPEPSLLLHVLTCTRARRSALTTKP